MERANKSSESTLTRMSKLNIFLTFNCETFLYVRNQNLNESMAID